MQHNPEFLKLVNEAKAQIKECDVHALKHELDSGNKDYLIIDVREESEYANGHVPNATHVSRGTIEVKIEKLIPYKAQPMMLYCGGGFRSALAAANLQKMGYTDVISVDGGMRAWLEAKYPVVKP